MAGLLGQPYDPYGGMSSLLGIDQSAMRKQALWEGLANAGFTLMGNKNLGAAGGAFLQGTNAARDNYMNTALDAYRLKTAEEERQYGRQRDATADERWQMQYDDTKKRQQRADAWQNTQMGWQMDDRQQQEDMRAGQQNQVQDWMGGFEAQGGNLFSPEMQQGLRQQGIQGVDPRDTQKYERMQPLAGANMYPQAFEQMMAEPAPLEPPKSRTIRRGNQQVTQEWNQQTGRFEDIAEGDAFKTAPDVVVNGDGMKLTEGQSKDVGFYSRGIYANTDLSQAEDALLSFAETSGGALPVVGNYLKSPAYRQAERAGREFLAIVLRKDTGAAVTQQEFELYGPMYLPTPGDDVGTLRAKKVARQRVMQAIRLGGGTAKPLFDQIDQEFGSLPPPAAPNVITTDDGYTIEPVGP